MFFLLLSLVHATCPNDCLLLGGNGLCNTICNIDDCFYDSYDCPPSCSNECFLDMINNGICDDSCYNADCGYDSPDCDALCSLGCDKEMIDDGICQETCRNQDCNFDGEDCESRCDLGCLSVYLADGICQEECMSLNCNFDNEDCIEFIWVNSNFSLGNGSKDKPYTSLSQAFTHQASHPHLKIVLSPGIHFWNQNITAPKTKYLTLESECQNCAVIRPLNPNLHMKFEGYLGLWIENIQLDGTEMWVKDCGFDYCIFSEIWDCQANSCRNHKGIELDLDSKIVNTFNKLDFWMTSSVILDIKNSIFWVTNFTLSNLDRVSSLFKSKDSTGVFQNLLVSHIQLIDYLIQADFNKISKIDARVSNEIFLFINKNENPSLITLKDSEFKDINQYFPIGILQNTWDIVKPGILKTTNIEIVQLENIKIEKMWNNYGKTLNSPQPLFSLNRISRCNIRHINITSSYIANGGIFKIDHYSFLLSEINEISVKFEDLFFNQIFIEGKTSLLNVTSTVIQPKISVKQLVLDNVNSYTASLMFFSFGELSPSFDGSVYLEPDTYEFEKRFLIIDDLWIKNSDLIENTVSIINSVNIELKNIKISNITKDTNTFFSEIADFYSLKYEDIIIHSLVASEPKTVFYVSNCEFLQADNIEITNSRLNDVINLHDTYQDINLKNLYQDSISANQYLNVVLSSDSNLTLQNITVFNSFFQDSIISLFSYSNISLDQISLQNTTAYSCIDSKFSWIFLNNFSAENLNLKSSALVMNPNSEISDFTIKNSLFSFIESDSAADIYINGKSDKKIIFMIKNTKFVSSQGKKLKSFSIAQNTEIVDGVFEHCEFRDMSLNNDVGVIGLFFVGQIRFISTVFQNIISLNRNSPIVYSEISLSSYSISNQTIEISNCLIKHNQISYFFVYDKQIISNDLKISNSEFYHNKGSLLYLTKSRVDIRDTEFKDNQGIGNYMIELHGTEISLLNTSFERNQGDALSGLLKSDMETQVYAEKVGIKDNNFEDTDLISSWRSRYEWTEFEFSSNTCDTSFNIYQSELVMKSGIFTENSQNLAVNSEKSQINFTDIIVTNQKNFVSVYSSNLNFQGIYIQDLSDTAFKVDTSIASLENILMNNTAKPFYIYNSNIKGNLMTINHATLTTVIKHSEVLISNLYFDNSNQGFEISNSNIDLSYIDVRNCISPLRIDSSNASIVNAYFKSNHDTALISYNSSMALIDSVLEENHGIDGGGIYITQPRSSRIRSTLFKNNTAYLGGGIYHDYSPVSIYNCEFFDNQAEYGNDVASYPRNILSLIPNYTNIQSGSIIENLTFLLQDIYNQPVSTQSLLSASIQSKTNNSVIGGANEVYAVDGKFVFKDLKIFNKPGESSSFLISTDNQDILPLEFSVSFRDCNIGEILSSDLSCNECENNTYSLSLDDQFCKACPAEASCLGGKDIFPVEGYWRSDVFSETFYVCPNHYACLGLKSDHTGGCGTGYQGTLCSICTEGYFRSNSYVCLECPQKWTSILLLLIALLVILAIIVGLVVSNIKSSLKEKSDFALLLKMMVGYIQTIMLFSSYYMKWPKILQHFLTFTLMAGDAPGQLVSFECQDWSIFQSLPTSLQTLLLINLLPFLFVLISVIFWGVFSVIKKNYSYMKTHLVCTVIVILCVFSSSLTNSLFSLFGCKDINGINLMTNDYSIECWEGSHWEITAIVGLPGITMWCIGFPITIFYLLYRNKNALNTSEIQSKYRSLYGGYKQKYYYWELLIIVRRMLVRGISVVLINYSLTVQGLTVILVLGFMGFLQLGFQPYDKSKMNHLEFTTIVLSILYMIAGMLISSGVGTVNEEIVGWTVFLANMFFFTYWGLLFYRALIQASKNTSIFKFISSKISSINKRWRKRSASVSFENIVVSRFEMSTDCVTKNEPNFKNKFNIPCVSLQDEESFDEPSINPW